LVAEVGHITYNQFGFDWNKPSTVSTPSAGSTPSTPHTNVLPITAPVQQSIIYGKARLLEKTVHKYLSTTTAAATTVATGPDAATTTASAATLSSATAASSSSFSSNNNVNTSSYTLAPVIRSDSLSSVNMNIDSQSNTNNNNNNGLMTTSTTSSQSFTPTSTPTYLSSTTHSHQLSAPSMSSMPVPMISPALDNHHTANNLNSNNNSNSNSVTASPRTPHHFRPPPPPGPPPPTPPSVHTPKHTQTQTHTPRPPAPPMPPAPADEMTTFARRWKELAAIQLTIPDNSANTACVDLLKSIATSLQMFFAVHISDDDTWMDVAQQQQSQLSAFNPRRGQPTKNIGLLSWDEFVYLQHVSIGSRRELHL
jgi:hypothetical protein